MDQTQLERIIAAGEDSRHQFKANVQRAESIAQEIVALSNSQGGMIIIGVHDDGRFSNLSSQDVARINQLISNAATQNIRPPVSVSTENIALSQGICILVDVPEGISKPYMDTALHVWVKSGSDKRKVSAREELQRMFQAANLIHADSMPVTNSSSADLDLEFFDAFFKRYIGESLDKQTLGLDVLLRNMNLMVDSSLNISGMLLFGKKPQFRLPVFNVKAVAFPGTSITDTNYIDSKDISGRLDDQFRNTMSFLMANLKHLQNGQSVNSIGEPEIPRIVLEEMLANAFIHRDYFVSAPIRVLIFADRVEIISPGHLPNNLTVEKIKFGNSNVRNPILASFAPHILPYRGLGSGVLRSIQAYPDIDFIDNRDGNLFKVIIQRKQI